MKQDFEKRFDEMYDHCDDFDPNYNSSITDEENLRNYAKILLSELKRA